MTKPKVVPDDGIKNWKVDIWDEPMCIPNSIEMNHCTITTKPAYRLPLISESRIISSSLTFDVISKERNPAIRMRVMVWGEPAEKCKNELKKGDKLHLRGHLNCYNGKVLLPDNSFLKDAEGELVLVTKTVTTLTEYKKVTKLKDVKEVL